MAGVGRTAEGEEFAPRELTMDQGLGDLAVATELYFRRLIDFLESRIFVLGGEGAECAAPLVSAKAAAELGLKASERLATSIGHARR